MQTVGFWARMGNLVRGGSLHRNVESHSGNGPHAGKLRDEADAERVNSSIVPRRLDRPQTVQRLEESCNRLNDLVGTIQDHLKAQDQKTQHIADSLASLTEPIGRVPEHLDAQHERLTSIVDQLESANSRGVRLEAAIGQIPDLAEGQRAAFTAISEQIAATHKTQDRFVQAMDGFREAVTSLNQTTAASAETLRGLHQASNSSHERTMKIVEDQNRKFTLLFTVAIVLASVVAAADIVTVFIR